VIHSYRGTRPVIHPTSYIVESAQIIGDVVIGKESSVWFNAVVRGDINIVRIGDRTNIQDGCLLHVRHDNGPLHIGSNVTLGHGVIAHGCVIEDNCLLGMGSIVLDNARINRYTLVAAGSVVRMNDLIPSGVLVAGVPGKVIRDLTQQERAMIDEAAKNYVTYAQQYRGSGA
jgi:carbonic anhydrase/acetyltransferase-like protein (isoleucine patch superfamily)